MIKLKSLITEAVEFDDVTKALQTAVKTFNDSASTVLANEEKKQYLPLSVSRQPINNIQSGSLITTRYSWVIKVGMANLFVLDVARYGAAKDVTNVGFSKILKIQKINLKIDGANANWTGDYVDLLFYNANGTGPTVIDATAILNNIYTNINQALVGSKYSESDAQYRNTATLILKSGPKLVEDLKAVFNSIEIAPFSPEGKKAWKRMQTV
jgi:hypothetical protein